ncbi:MAG: hypothetical protein RMI50_00885 [Aquificaceae bacterium]|nr:hypothetical protein [Aquificaceae bacterium]
MKKLLLLVILFKLSFAFFPFEAEDAGTLGGLGNFQFEANYANFRHYGGLRRQSFDFQFQAGILRNLDFAVVQPYVKIRDGQERISGVDDLRVFVKHVPFEGNGWRVGYRLQLNLDTGKKGIGYGSTTANLNLILERDIGKLTLNLNGVYIRSSHVEGLRDAYGVILHAYGEVFPRLTLGGEIKYAKPEEKDLKWDAHLLLGMVFHATKSTNISLGLHKSLHRQEGEPNYGFLVGFLQRF